MGSFDSRVSYGQYTIRYISGDALVFPVLFDVDISGVAFEFFVWPNVGATKIVDYTEASPNVSVVSGDPDVVQNSLTVSFDEATTLGWDFDCVQYRLRWDLGEGFRTLIIGDIVREG